MNIKKEQQIAGSSVHRLQEDGAGPGASRMCGARRAAVHPGTSGEGSGAEEAPEPRDCAGAQHAPHQKSRLSPLRRDAAGRRQRRLGPPQRHSRNPRHSQRTLSLALSAPLYPQSLDQSNLFLFSLAISIIPRYSLQLHSFK